MAETGTLKLQELVPKRILSVDILRGIVMVVMALDHTRDFFSDYKGNPLDFDHASIWMFFTRWITHFCAPVFVFLAGTSAFLSMSKGKTQKEISLFLLKRGIWLIILELTIVRFGWAFNLDYSGIFLQVIWAIGCSMIFLSLLVLFPRIVILITGLLIVFVHNAFDTINIAGSGLDNAIWHLLHQNGRIPYGSGNQIFVLYPIIPWIGVMPLGYCFGAVLQRPEKERNKLLYTISLSAIALFVILRLVNIYGDLHPWVIQSSAGNDILAFIRVEKYPPSLDYLLMTLGIAISLMPSLEKMYKPIAGFFTVYGRVPLFYYVLHLYLLHAMALITGLILGYPIAIFTSSGAFFDPNIHWGFSLGIVYIFWISAILILYFPSKWFMGIKLKYKKWWLSYL